ncbi:MAG: tetratricopeptide repeat protein [Myxococcota bacterium]|nr:tetratricopeptide repeat protein [Myxococcota bacterium]
MNDSEIARLKRVVRASPDSLQFVALGESLRRRGELDAAHKVLSSGLRYHPNLHSGQSTLARVFAERGEADQALPLVTGLLQRDPGDIALRVLHVELLIALNRRRDAAEAVARVPETDPRRAGLVARLGRPGDFDPFATRELALRLERAGRLSRAAAVWEVIARQESDPEASREAERLQRRISRPAGLEEVTLRDERSHTSGRSPSRPGPLRRLLTLLRRAEQEK